MRLRDDPRLLEIAVGGVAAITGIPAGHIEKDFWLTEALRRMAAVADADRFTLLFKGGTSLSKAYRLIERFSEDVDLLVVMPASSKGEQDRLLRRRIDGTRAEARRMPGARPSARRRLVAEEPKPASAVGPAPVAMYHSSPKLVGQAVAPRTIIGQ